MKQVIGDIYKPGLYILYRSGMLAITACTREEILLWDEPNIVALFIVKLRLRRSTDR